jgi:hypothetical protein
VESLDPEGPYGAKEAGEGPLHPSIPAIANAIYDAVGVRMDSLPFTPPRVWRALQVLPIHLPAAAPPTHPAPHPSAYSLYRAVRATHSAFSACHRR